VDTTSNSYDITQNVTIHHDTTPIPQAGPLVVQGEYGELTIHEDGTYSYELDDAHPVVQALSEGDSINEKFSVNIRANNAAGETSDDYLNPLTITINGTNDAPIAIDDIKALTEVDVTAANYTGDLEYTTHMDGIGGYDASPDAVALGSDGSYVVTWYGRDSNGDYSIFTQKFDASGAKSGDMQMIEAIDNVSGDDYKPQVEALGEDGSYAMTWYGEDSDGDYSIFVQKFDQYDQKSGNVIQLEANGNTTESDIHPKITSIGENGEFAVTWYGKDSESDDSIFVQKFDQNAQPFGAAVQLEANGNTTGADAHPTITSLESGEYLVTWYGYNASNSREIFIQKFNNDGSQNGTAYELTTPSHDFTPQITSLGDDGSYVVVWYGYDNTGDLTLFSQKFDPSGNETGDRHAMDVYEGGNASDQAPRVAEVGNDGSYVVSWQGKNADNEMVACVQKFAADGTKEGTQTLLDGSEGYIGWNNSPSVASIGNDGVYIAVWTSRTPENVYQVYAQRFDANGVPDGAIEHINALDGVEKSAANPKVISVGEVGDYVIVWSGKDEGNDNTIFSQKFSADGTPIGLYTEGSSGDFDITTDVTGANYYEVTYSTGTLMANGTEYPSGSRIPASEWVDVKLVGAEGANYDLVIQADVADIITDEDTALTIQTADLLANDTDIDGDTLTITSVQEATNGTVVLNGDGTITFTPDANYYGEATFTYTVDDGNGGTDTATVTLNVTSDGIIEGTSGADALTGTTGDDLINGLEDNDTLTGGEGNDSIWGDDGDDTLHGGQGGDMLYGGQGDDNLRGGAGNDIYRWSPGDGSDVINEENLDGNDRIEIGGGLTADDMVFTRDGNNLIITAPSGETLTVASHAYVDPWGKTKYRVESMSFDDGSTLSLTSVGLTYDSAAGDETFLGYAGNDTYRWSPGNGSDVINEDNRGGNDRIEISGGLTADDMVFTLDGNNLIITAPSGETLTVASHAYVDPWGKTKYRVESMSFDDGSTLNLAGGIPTRIDGTAGDDTLTGGAGQEIIVGDDGADVINGAGGADLLFGGNDADVINGGTGNDWLYGDAGDDTLTGGEGNDTIDGGADSDTVIYSGDAIDYSVTDNEDGTYTITDMRAGSPDGTDTVTEVEFFQFADGTYSAGVLVAAPTFIDGSEAWDDGATANGGTVDSSGNIVDIKAVSYSGAPITYTLVDTDHLAGNLYKADGTKLYAGDTLTQTEIDGLIYKTNKADGQTGDVSFTLSANDGSKSTLTEIALTVAADTPRVSPLLASNHASLDISFSDFTGTTIDSVNTYTTNNQYYPDVTSLEDGGWVITWHSYGQDGDNYGIYQQRYDADGLRSGSETEVNTYTANSQAHSSVTSLDDGGWVVTWISFSQDGDSIGIYQQQYDLNGAPIGSETLVNTYTTDSQTNPIITSLSDGGWVVTWNSDGQDGSGTGIYQQRYNANGTPSGTETLVNTYTSGNQGYPSVTALDDGGWVVTWHSQNQDGDNYGIYQQRYDATGAVSGVETQVNSYTTGSQTYPVATSLEDGGWIVTWLSKDQDGSGMGVYQQRYDSNGNAVADPSVTYSGTGDFTIETTATYGEYDDIESYTVTYTEGVLSVNGVSYVSGSTIPAATYEAGVVKLEGVNADNGTYDLIVIANYISTTLEDLSIADIIEGPHDDTITGNFTTLNTIEASGTANASARVQLVDDEGSVVGETIADDSGNWSMDGLNLTTADQIDLVVADKEVQSDRTPSEGPAHIVSGDGDDTIEAVGTYRVEAGGGDDIIKIVDTSFDAIDGGIGSDTVLLEENFNMDFDTLANKTSNIEKVDLTEGDHEVTNVNLADVVKLTDTNNDLIFKGDSGDKVTLKSDDGWIKGESTTVDGEEGSFSTYTNIGDATVKLFIDEDINVPDL
jgi:VCBS repeat-containing protein